MPFQHEPQAESAP